jgi:hypothetical protein
MNLSKAKQIVRKIIPKKFRKPTLIEQRDALKSLKLKILANPPMEVLREIEDIVRTKGKKSKELSWLKSRVALDFNEKFLGVKLTPAKREQAAELMRRLEQRENSVAAIGRKKAEDIIVIELKKELNSLFPTMQDALNFRSTYKLYGIEISNILKKSGY